MKKKALIILSILCLLFLFAAVGCDISGNITVNPDGNGNNNENNNGNGGGNAEAQKFTVTLDFDDTLGTIVLTPEAENNVYEKGAAVTAEVSPLPGRVLESFKADGVEKELDGGKYAFTVEKDMTLSAEFSAVTMPEDLFESLLGKTAYKGTGNEKRVYDGYEDIPIDYSYDFEAVFDEDLAFHSKYENKMNLFLYSMVYKNEDGKAVTYARTLQNTIERKETEDDFGLYDNPFESLSANDFLRTEEYAYTLTDASKAAAAAFAFTGAEEEIANFTVYVTDGKIGFIQIDTPDKAIGDGITIEHYTYSSHYTFDVAEPADLESRMTPYATESGHADLKAAFEKAAAAKSYKYHVTEDKLFDYNFYVTEKAIYNDEKGFELGYFLHSDGLVHQIYLNDEGKLVIGKPVQGTVDGEHYTTTSDIAALKPIFAGFAAELFEPKGDGVFEMRTEDPELIQNVANFLWSFGDDMTMNFAQSVSVKVENGALSQAVITTKTYGFDTIFEIAYSGWNSTELPLPIEGAEGGGTTPDGPVTPPATAPYPAKFVGKYKGENWRGTAYTVEIGENGTIFVSISEEAATVSDIGYNAASGKITLTVNSVSCTISVSGNTEAENVQSISFAADDNSFSVTLDRVAEGGETVAYPEDFYGIYEGDDTIGNVRHHFVVTIGRDGITVTMDGTAATVVVTGYNAQHKEIELTFNGTACGLSLTVNSDGEVESIGIMAEDLSINLTIPRKAEGGEGGGAETPASGKEKFYGTYEGSGYVITISQDGITVTINGEKAEVTDVSFDGQDYMLTINGEKYTIMDNSDTNPVTDIALSKVVGIGMYFLTRQP